ncbi:Potassium/proton antiporter RosB [Klebsiella pneumoniae]|uniref:Potassium/proton antiporter RosB n=1 Tax=Klebsiella pneumoniae TaxID=573 RepID=A0A2X3EDV5_KLEPN|nr:Potassium/proton antiporter RosB [Klebsiella pneumoniae]
MSYASAGSARCSAIAANEEIMELAHLDCARWLLLTIPNGYEAGEIVASAREKCPNIEIIARAHYDDEVDYIIDREPIRW